MANIKTSVFNHLDEMFKDHSPWSWGSATFVRNVIRQKFGLTHKLAKSLHEEWAEAKG